jgi:hypothetical protein
MKLENAKPPFFQRTTNSVRIVGFSPENHSDLAVLALRNRKNGSGGSPGGIDNL